jgi:hypothetical protein
LAPNDTWEFSGGMWTKVPTLLAPPARTDASLAFDAADGYLVLFGGCASTCYPPLHDTWKFQNGTWAKISSTGSPPARAQAAMTYDAANRIVLLFGGWTYGPSHPAGKFFNDTWEFSKGAWTPLAVTVAPSPRAFAAITYDAYDRYVVLFGGCFSANRFGISACLGSVASTALNDTWTFVNGTWTLITAVGPTARSESALAYDSTTGDVILFGGRSTAGLVSNDTWAFRSGTWTQLAPTGSPPPQAGSPLVLDMKTGQLLLFQASMGGTHQTEVWRLG